MKLFKYEEMLPSTGFFKGINCPFYESGLCERPYCHFRHVRKDPETNSESIENGEILQQLVSEAVKKVLLHTENNPGDVEAALKSQNIISKVVQELKPVTVNSSTDSTSSLKATYNPTPISELKKIVPGENEFQPAAPSRKDYLNRKHIPVPYTPHRPSRSSIIRAPIKTVNKESVSSSPIVVDQDKYTPVALESESNVKYLPGSVGEHTPTPYSPIDQSTGTKNSVQYTPSDLSNVNRSSSNISGYTPTGQGLSGASYSPGAVVSVNYSTSSYCPKSNSYLGDTGNKSPCYTSTLSYKPTPLKKIIEPTFSSDEDEPTNKKIKLNNSEKFQELEDLDSEFEILGQILDDENNDFVKPNVVKKPETIIDLTENDNTDIIKSSHPSGKSTVISSSIEILKHSTNSKDIFTKDFKKSKSLDDDFNSLLNEKSSEKSSHKSERHSSTKTDSENKLIKNSTEKNSSKYEKKISKEENIKSHSSKKSADDRTLSKDKDKNKSEKNSSSSKHRSKSVDSKHENSKSKTSSHSSTAQSSKSRHSSSDHKSEHKDSKSKNVSSSSSSSHRDSKSKSSSKKDSHRDSSRSKESSGISSNQQISKSKKSESTSSGNLDGKSKSSSSKSKPKIEEHKDFKSKRSESSKSHKSSHSKEKQNKRNSPEKISTQSGSAKTKECPIKEMSESESDNELIEEFSDSDEETITQECLKIFEEYVPTTKKETSHQQTSKQEPVSETSQINSKKRVAHNTNLTVYRSTPVSIPDHKSKALQLATDRFSKVKQFHNERLGLKKEIIPSSPIQNEPPVSQTCTSSKVRIAHVPNVSILLNAKKALKVPEIPKVTPVQTISKGSSRVAHMPNDKFSERPGVLEPLSSKIPVNIRSNCLNLMIDECLKIYLTPEDSYARAQQEELNTYKKCTSIPIYKNSSAMTISRLRKEIQEAGGVKINSSGSSQSISHSKLLLGKHAEKTSWSIENKYKKDNTEFAKELKGNRFYENISKWILTEQELQDNGFPRPHPERREKGYAKIYTKNTKQKPQKGFIRWCCRCKKEYTVDKKGLATLNEECIYHPNNKYRFRGEVKYQCCQQDGTSDGCLSAACHVYEYTDHDNLRGYVTTLPKDKRFDHGVYALDCEMCYTTNGLDLTRVTVIDSNLSIVYETFIKPLYPIIDYNTRYSGITEEHLRNVTTSLLEVQATFLHMFSNKTILVGHSLESDFKALKLIHDTVVDTSVLFPHKMGPPYKRALRNLSSEYLKKIIQNSLDGHDSAEDATVCMELLIWKLKEELKTR